MKLRRFRRFEEQGDGLCRPKSICCVPDEVPCRQHNANLLGFSVIPMEIYVKICGYLLIFGFCA